MSRRLRCAPLAACVVLCASLLVTVPAAGQVFGQFAPATVLPSGQSSMGAYGIFTDDSWGALGRFTLGLGGAFDASLSGGFSSYEDSPGIDAPNTLRLGLDGRYQIRWAQPGAPVDASLGLGLGFESGSDLTRFDIAPQALASHRIVYDEAGRAVTPYGSLALDLQFIDAYGESSDDLDLLARFGGAWEPSSYFCLTAEMGFGDGVRFAAGARWTF